MAAVKKINERLTKIPDELSRAESIYINISEMDYTNNEFEEIPDTICLFRSLVKINFSCNKLKELPDWLFDLKRLESINVNQNKIARLNAYNFIDIIGN